MIGSTLSRMAAAEKLSIPQLQRAIQDGTLPAYVGIPILQDKVKQEQLMKAAAAGAQGGQRPTVADQVMQQATAEEAQNRMAQGVDQLPVEAPSMAGGGIVAFAEGGDTDSMTAEDYADYMQEAEDDEDDARQAGLLRKLSLMGSPDMEMSYKDVAGGKLAAGQKAGAYKGITGDHKYSDLIRSEAKKVGLDPEYALKIAMIETGGLKNPESARSKAGAIGIMQLMPATAKGLGVDPTVPEENVRGGVSMLKRLVDKYGDYELAGAAYNAGEGRVDRALRSGNLAGLPGETQGYMGKIRGMAEGGYTGPQDGDAIAMIVKSAQPQQENSMADNPVIQAITGQQVDPAAFGARGPEMTDNPAIRHILGLPPKTMKTGGAVGYADGGETTIDPVTGEVYTPEYEGQGSDLLARLKKATGYGKMLPESERGWPTEAPAAPAAPAATKPVEKSVARAPAAKGVDMTPYKNDPNYIEALTGTMPGEPTKQQAAKPEASIYDRYIEQLMANEGKRADQAEQDKWMSLLTAGLGMMGGTSPYASANIGQGAMAGISNYAALRKQAAAQEAAETKNMLLAQKYKESGELARQAQAASEAYRQQDLGVRVAGQTSADLARKQSSFDQYKKEGEASIEKQYGSLMVPDAKAALERFYSSPEFVTARNAAFPDLPQVKPAGAGLPQGVIVRPR